MHGQYGLHAPSITACGIAWGLHYKQNSIHLQNKLYFYFFSLVHVNNVLLKRYSCTVPQDVTEDDNDRISLLRRNKI